MSNNSAKEKAKELQRIAQALFDQQAFAKKVEDILKKRRPAEVPELLKPRRRKDAYSNVIITYFGFPAWLARFDPGLIRPLAVNITSYR